MDSSLIWEWVIKSLVLILGLTAGFAYVTLLERRLLAWFQVRIGPNRVGPWGLLQPVADGVKLIFKEELTPKNADKVLFTLAPILTVIPALIITAVVPWGPPVRMFGREIALQMADLNVGVLYIMAVTSISVYGITLAGWSSNNKYAMLGGLRATAQMISYEIALGFAMIGPVILAGSMSMNDIVEAQSKVWFVVPQFVAFVIYFISSTAEINRAPFDMPEAEQELTAGYLTEYGGMKFAVSFMAEYIKLIAISMIGSSLFLGGYQPLFGFLASVPVIGVIFTPNPLWLFLKMFAWMFVIIWLRATLPRIRYDRLMMLGWKILFPLAVANVVVTALVIILVGG